MLVEFTSSSGDDKVTLRLPHPASEDPIQVAVLIAGNPHVEREVASIYVEIAEFAIEASKVPDGWRGKTSFSSLEDDFVMICRARNGDYLLLEFVLEGGAGGGDGVAIVSFEVPILTMVTIGTEVTTWVKQC